MKLSKFSLKSSISYGLLIPSIKTVLMLLSFSKSSFIFCTVNSATIYCPNSSLKVLAVVPVSSPLSAAFSLIMSPILTTSAPFSIAVSKKILFPEPCKPVTPITFIIIPFKILFLYNSLFCKNITY